jgi:hypothetical protein
MMGGRGRGDAEGFGTSDTPTRWWHESLKRPRSRTSTESPGQRIAGQVRHGDPFSITTDSR